MVRLPLGTQSAVSRLGRSTFSPLGPAVVRVITKQITPDVSLITSGVPAGYRRVTGRSTTDLALQYHQLWPAGTPQTRHGPRLEEGGPGGGGRGTEGDGQLTHKTPTAGQT